MNKEKGVIIMNRKTKYIPEINGHYCGFSQYYFSKLL